MGGQEILLARQHFWVFFVVFSKAFGTVSIWLLLGFSKVVLLNGSEGPCRVFFFGTRLCATLVHLALHISNDMTRDRGDHQQLLKSINKRKKILYARAT